MRRASLKTILCFVFCAGVAVYLSGCVEPVDLSSFAKDSDVTDIIDKSSGTVNITLDTYDNEHGLKAGNQKITGLADGKYYMVEEWDSKDVEKWDENKDPLKAPKIQFVTPSGVLSERLSDIGRVTNKGENGGEIIGLTNRNYYRVRSAEPLPGNVTYNVLTSPTGSAQPPALNTNGAITLPCPEDNSYIVYTLTPPAGPASYEIAEVPISPAGSTMPSRRSSGDANSDIITLISRETVIDYVFFGSIPDVRPFFYVLNVTSTSGPIVPPEPPKPGIKITLVFTGDNSPQPEPTGMSYSLSTPTPGTLNFYINESASYTNFVWYVDGTQVGTNPTFGLNFALEEYRILGRYAITVEARKNGMPYAATIEVTVTE